MSNLKRWICKGFREGDFDEWTPCAFAPCKVVFDVKPSRCTGKCGVFAKEPVWHEVESWEK